MLLHVAPQRIKSVPVWNSIYSNRNEDLSESAGLRHHSEYVEV